jgi:phage tail sheath gpL-like
MAEQLTKLRPDRDLQCYFERPSAVAALSSTSAGGFTVSGCWRQQFDWLVIEWNRDNVFEHPALRNLPDGDLSGLQLSYQEVRTNCIPLDSTLYPTVDWPYLRVWAESGGTETLYKVPLKNYATAVGEYADATVEFELQGTPTAGDYIELAWLDQHFNYRLTGGDTLASSITALAAAITANQATGAVSATASGTHIVLTYHSAPGSNGNRIGVYGTVHGAGTESWAPAAANFTGGVSPERWKVQLNFSALQDSTGAQVPTTRVRKMRWTWAADLQSGDFERSEFAVAVTNWSVGGTNVGYSVAGTGSRRIEDDADGVVYVGEWVEARGNYSGGSIRWTDTPGARVSCTYSANGDHWLYLGTRLADQGGQVAVQVDGGAAVAVNLAKATEDVLVRVPIAAVSGQAQHTVTITHTGANGTVVYFDFLEIAYPSVTLPDFDRMEQMTLATDWDTDHSLAIAPERTAWLIQKLGFQGRANHYAGAMWFYELHMQGNSYASGTITFSGMPEFGKKTQVFLGPTPIEHLNLIGDTPASIATCFALLINAGSTGVWARAEGAVLTITSRVMGSAGNALGISANTNSTTFSNAASGTTLAGGVDGVWRTDTTAPVKLNRASRDWNRAFFQALKGYGIEVTAAFSMELQHGDDTPQAQLAQRYPNGDPVWLNTPALQTNFGPESTAFWLEIYSEMADLMTSAGVQPYVQFGEVQWWYFAAASGMPFYDSYTTTTFQARYGKSMAAILTQNADPGAYTDECAFLPELIGEFTSAVMAHVRQTHPDARFEVLYPPDVNDTALNRLVNFPHAYWTPAILDSLKTENFTYTGDRDLNKALASIELPMQLGFGRSQSSHLVGIGEYTTPWSKEQRLATGEQLDSVVLFALDQFCLIGYPLPLDSGARRSQYMGG